MKKIRIGNDIILRIAVTRLSEAEDFTGKTLRLTLHCAFETLELPFTVIGNKLTAAWLGTEQKRTGAYTVTLTEDYGDGSRNTVDKCCAFALVPRSCDEVCGQTGTQYIDHTLDVGDATADIDLDISAPANGLSAYDIAVVNGFTGTEAEWLASLKGEAQVAMVLSFAGYAENPTLSQDKCDAPDIVLFDEERLTFIAAKRNDAGSLTYYADFDTYASFAAKDYGSQTAYGRLPVAQRMYYDTDSDTLTLWDGQRLRRMYEAYSEEEIRDMVN